MPVSSKKRVLILCTGNSCRSQMAEAFINRDFQDEWLAFSAGSRPSGYVHPLAIVVMGEAGIDITNHRSKDLALFRDQTFDLVVTVCDNAAEDCPLWVGEQGHKIHVGFPDPAEAEGDEAARLAVFRKVRDDIQNQITNVLKSIPVQ